MSIFQNKAKSVILFMFAQLLFILPVLAIDLDSTVKDSSRQNYTKQTQTVEQQTINTKNVEPDVQQPTEPTKQETTTVEIKQDLPKVPNLPKNVNSTTVAPINTQYSGNVPNANAFIPATDIKVDPLIVDEKISKQKTVQQKTKQTTPATKQQTYRTAILPKGTQVRVVNSSKITDYFCKGQNVVFTSTQDISTSYLKLPKGTRFNAKVADAHRPQMSCNGGLVGIRIVSVQANGYTQPIDAGIIKIKTDNIHFSNLKGEHTYLKNTCKKAKWGQNKFKQWSKTSRKLANNGAGVIIAPFPYLGGCVLAAASTVSSPVTALLAKGGNLTVPANTVFTIKLYEDARLRY